MRDQSLTAGQRLGRELICWTIGHRLQGAPTVEREVPLERPEPAQNRYLRPLTSWRLRCRRCRSRWFSGDPWVPLPAVLYHAARDAGWNLRFARREAAWYRFLPAIPIVALRCLLQHLYMERGLPWGFVDPIINLEHWLLWDDA